MAKPGTPRKVRLSVEPLEARDVPAAPWALETFDSGTPGSLPAGWTQTGSDLAPSFQIAPGQGLGSPAGLISAGGSDTASRAWMVAPFDADVQVRTAVYLNSLAPAAVFVRGQNLDTDAPTYYSVAVTRGMDVQLRRVVNGQATVLAEVQSASWLSNQWVEVSLTAEGDVLRVQVFRTDTAQYLNADGTWQATPAYAMEGTDGASTGPGQVGLARPASVAGQVNFDNFEVTTQLPDDSRTALSEQHFDQSAGGGLPAGWSQWSNDQSGPFEIQADPSALTGSSALNVNGASGGVARAWLDSTLPGDVQASAALYLDSLVPAQLFVRGQKLDGDHPNYYAASIVRGGNLQLLRVVDGQATVLGEVDSNQWLSDQWVQVSLVAQGDTLKAQVYRTDTAQYLNADGTWQVTPTWALTVRDSVISGQGKAGLARASSYSGSLSFDNFAVTTAPGTGTAVERFPFDNSPAGQLPSGWGQWTSNGAGGFQVAPGSAVSSPNSLASNGGSADSARTWVGDLQPADVEVKGAVYLDGPVPGQLFLRGQNPDTNAPTYYAVSVTRGLDLQLLRVVDGQTTVLGTLSSQGWQSNQWVRVSLKAEGDVLTVRVVRTDTNQYLAPDMTWQSDPVDAMTVTDGTISDAGYVGVNRPALYAGRVLYDDLTLTPVTPTVPPDPGTSDGGDPQPTDGGSASGPSDGGNPTPPPPPPPPPPPSGGNTNPPPAAGLPDVPQHYPWIRIAELAYIGTPMDAFAQQLLQNGVDLVIPNSAYLNQISQVAPNTPQLIYSNASNIYLSLLTDWLNYADAHGLNREGAFYHVSEATPFTGDSASSQPVNWFWGVQRGNDSEGWTDLTLAAHSPNQTVAFGGAGEVLNVGYTEKFREINLSLQQAAAAGWSSQLEYVTAVDANGNPTAWAPLTTITDGTRGLTGSGTITFDPPADWVTASINGGPRLYYVRFRTTSDGSAPVAASILGRDYVNAGGDSSGIIPAFDYKADKNHDGYLSDAEYAKRRPGYDARFAYETRLFYPAYGQMRFATNPGDAGFQSWAADYSYRYLASQPNASGLFLDNSFGRLPVDVGSLIESTAAYAKDYGALLATINAKIAPKWVLANTAGAGASADPLVKDGVSYLEEFGLRPMTSNFTQFEDLASLFEKRQSLSGGQSYAILDSYLGNFDPTDPRAQVSTLAEYYLLADPKTTFLMFNGGSEPASTWTRHWSNAVTFDVGKPLDEWSVAATGRDPSNTRLTYKVYERDYENALVLYKPLSYGQGKGTGTTADDTATTMKLNGSYRALNADGTLGPVVNSIRLRNGEGAILVKA